MYAARVLIQPIIRVSLASVKSSACSRLKQFNLGADYGPMRACLNAFKLKVHRNMPDPYWNLVVRKYNHHVRNGIVCSSGGKFTVSMIVGLSVLVGSISIWPRIRKYIDGFGFLAEGHDFGMLDYSESDEEHRALVTALRKFLVPVFFILTVLMNWGQPIVIATKVTLLLCATNPTPFSAYLFVEQLRHQDIRQRVTICNTQSCYAKKVQVEDYKFLCLARVELNDQNLTLLGILGSWWVLPLSSWHEALSTLRNRFLVT